MASHETIMPRLAVPTVPDRNPQRREKEIRNPTIPSVPLREPGRTPVPQDPMKAPALPALTPR